MVIPDSHFSIVLWKLPSYSNYSSSTYSAVKLCYFATEVTRGTFQVQFPCAWCHEHVGWVKPQFPIFLPCNVYISLLNYVTPGKWNWIKNGFFGFIYKHISCTFDLHKNLWHDKTDGSKVDWFIYFNFSGSGKCFTSRWQQRWSVHSFIY